MSETSLHHCVSDIVILWNKGELHLFSHQRLVRDPIEFFQKC